MNRSIIQYRSWQSTALDRLPKGRIFLILAMLVVVSLPSELLQARTWTARSGTSTVEAELVDAKGDRVVLRRADGRLIEVPLAQLSLGDVHYVHEAMKAAGMVDDTTDSAESQTPPVSAADANNAPVSERPAAPVGGPPLASEEDSGWQAAADPPPEDWVIPTDVDFRLSVPTNIGAEDTIFAIAGSPFVALGSNTRNAMRQMWDLRSGKRVGALRDELTGLDKLAISPDGVHMAATSHQWRGKIRVFSFQTGKVVRDLDLGAEFSSIYGLDFAGADRVVAAVTLEKAIVAWSLSTGEEVTKVDIYPVPMRTGYAISPSGSYLALVRDNKRVDIFDLRNGVAAGDFPIPADESSGYAAIQALDFSADGREIAMLVTRGQQTVLYCWSMESGRLVVQHRLTERISPSSAATRRARATAIDWIPEQQGWLVHGRWFVDRQQGGPVWKSDDPRSAGYPTIRRIVDSKRMVVVSGERDARTLRFEEIPWVTIDESRRIVTSGGTVDDLGLPEILQANMSAVRSVSLADASGEYHVAKTNPPTAVPDSVSVSIDQRIGVVRQTRFASPEVGRVLVNGNPRDYRQSRSDMAAAMSGQMTDVYDLRSGKRLYKFDVPFATELQDFSPSGELGLFRYLQDKNRLDVFDLTSGEHVVGFRPYSSDDPSHPAQVNWAAFVDDKHLLSLSRDGQLTLWELDGCRALYTLPLSSTARVTVDKTRKYGAISSGGTLHLIELMTGQSCGRLPLPDMMGSFVVSAGVFRQDGARFAVTCFLEDAGRLLVWDTVSRDLICDLTLPISSFGMTWTDPDHVALYDAGRDGDPGQLLRKAVVVDVPTQRVIWNYKVHLNSDRMVEPDDRMWFFAFEGGRLSLRLSAVTLPDAKAAEIVAETPAPEALFGKGTQVALNIHIGGMPDGLEDRRKQEKQFEQELLDHFTSALTEQGVTVDNSAPVALDVTLKNLTRDDIIQLGSRFGITRSHTVILSSSTVLAQVTLSTDEEQVLWWDDELKRSGDVKVRNAPPGMPLSTFIHLRQWELGKQWCLAVILPKRVFGDDAYRGAGESSILAEGIQYLRRYQPTQRP